MYFVKWRIFCVLEKKQWIKGCIAQDLWSLVLENKVTAVNYKPEWLESFDSFSNFSDLAFITFWNQALLNV